MVDGWLLYLFFFWFFLVCGGVEFCGGGDDVY